MTLTVRMSSDEERSPAVGVNAHVRRLVAAVHARLIRQVPARRCAGLVGIGGKSDAHEFTIIAQSSLFAAQVVVMRQSNKLLQQHGRVTAVVNATNRGLVGILMFLNKIPAPDFNDVDTEFASTIFEQSLIHISGLR